MPDRAGGCRVTEGTLAGWPSVELVSDRLSVTVLPTKGAEIQAIVDRESGIDLLFKAPWGLAAPGAPPRPGSAGTAFLENYAGGWQELFPNTNDACEHAGAELPFHGEVATLPWRWSVEAAGRAEAAVRFAVDCRRTPFRLERVLRVTARRPALLLEERVTNRSAAAAALVWGHHCVLGAPLVGAGAELRVPCRTVVTIPEVWEQTARLVPGQRSGWPHAALRAGGTVDLSRVPGPEAGSHDDVYLTDLAAGWAEVANPALGLGFRLDWDPTVFRWVISWQPFGGARAMPLRGSYGLGLEPWTAGGNLAAAVAAGEAIELAGGASLETTLSATVTPGVAPGVTGPA